MFVLFKWLLWLCMPFTLVLLGLAAVGLWLLWRRQVRPALCVLLLDAALTVMGLPAISTALGAGLEGKFPPVALRDIPKADAIVVLGGGVGAAREGSPYPECYPAADRVVMAARLYHAGKAPLVIPTGGGAPLAEKPLLETMRVPASAILCEDAARDTAENAAKTFALLRAKGCKKALVVTSAWHLPRAMMLFQAPDLTFVPVGCDYEATLAALDAPRCPLWMKLPSPQAIAQTGVYLKEWLGILFYSFRKPTEGRRDGRMEGQPNRKDATARRCALRRAHACAVGGMEGWRDGGMGAAALPPRGVGEGIACGDAGVQGAAVLPAGGTGQSPVLSAPPSLHPSIPPTAQASGRRSPERRAFASLRLDRPSIPPPLHPSNAQASGRRSPERRAFASLRLDRPSIPPPLHPSR